ncbi:MAG: hypothetical protein N2043_10490 [Ignavibacterium sp.]|nr:hypothetical protein [Ignavibacterium sp.]
MKEVNEFNELISKIEAELIKLENINKNLSKIDNYVEEVSLIRLSLKENLTKLIEVNKQLQKNLDDSLKNLVNSIQKIIKSVEQNKIDISNSINNLNNELIKSFKKELEKVSKFQKLNVIFLIINLILTALSLYLILSYN